MIKLALVTGLIVGAGYWFIMSAAMNMTLSQVKHYQQQYQQAIALAEQMGDGGASATNR